MLLVAEGFELFWCDLQEVLSQTDHIIAVRLNVLDHPVHDSAVRESGINPGPLSCKAPVARESFTRGSRTGRHHIAEALVLARATAARDGHVHFGALAAACVGQSVEGVHASGLVELDYELANKSRVCADDDEQVLLELFVISRGVVQQELVQLRLQLLEQQFNFEVELVLYLSLVLWHAD